MLNNFIKEACSIIHPKVLGTRLNLVYLIFLLSLTARAQTITLPDRSMLSPHIDSVFRKYKANTPGVVISIIHNGKIQLMKAYGSANLEYDILNTTYTKFHVASISKQFTAFSVLLLQESGRLSLEDDIRKYIPEVPDFGHTITLRHLASHTSGLRDQWNLLLLAGVGQGDIINTEHILTLISEQKELNFEPGEEYLYCNTGYTLLAEVVSRVSGQTFAEFTQEHIFSPLKMTNTSFVDDHEKIIKNKAYSYYSANGTAYRKRVLNYENVGPTNLLTTVEDLSLWMLNFKNLTVGSHNIIEQMTTEARLNNGKTFGGGLGLFMNSNYGITEIEHGGADAGFRAHLSIYPSVDLGIAIVSNAAESDTRMLASEVADYLLKDLPKTSPIQPEKKQLNYINLESRLMEPFVGYYWTKEHAYTRHIYLKNDTLMHFRTENNESPLAPISKNEFKVMNVPVDALVRFEERNGETVLIETVNDGEPIVLTKFSPVQYTEADWEKYEGEYYSGELKTVYAIQWVGNKLIAKHIRMGNIELRMVKHNFFLGNRGFFGNVEFLRDNRENVIGFRVSNGRVRDLLFAKN